MFPYTDDNVPHPSVSFKGRHVRHSIRKHTMAAVSKGLGTFNPGTILRPTATFLILYLCVSAPLEVSFYPSHVTWSSQPPASDSLRDS